MLGKVQALGRGSTARVRRSRRRPQATWFLSLQLPSGGSALPQYLCNPSIRHWRTAACTNVGMFNKEGIHLHLLVIFTVCLRDGHRAIGKHNHMRRARTWADDSAPPPPPVNSTRQMALRPRRTRPTCFSAFGASLQVSAATFGRRMADSRVQKMWENALGKCQYIANILPIYCHIAVYWHIANILPICRILPRRTCAPYCGPQWSHHVQSFTRRPRFDFFRIFFLGKIIAGPRGVEYHHQTREGN